MKIAYFNSRYGNGRLISGKVILRNDGKVSISLSGATYGTSWLDRNHAKNIAKQIVTADFKHEAIVGEVESDNDRKGLITNLTEQTQDFKKLYLQRVKEWATRVYHDAEEKKTWSPTKWIKEYGEEPILDYHKRPMQQRLYNKLTEEFELKPLMRLKRAGRETKAAMNATLSRTFEKHLDNERLAAERHYIQSIERLALRLNNKGVTDKTEMEIVKTSLGANFEMTIKHDGLITRAWTIIAEGPVQRPHYRYLVK